MLLFVSSLRFNFLKQALFVCTHVETRGEWQVTSIAIIIIVVVYIDTGPVTG